MANKPNRYKEMERYLTYALGLDTILFILFLIVAGNGIIWLKVILLLLGLFVSGCVLWVLYNTKEILKQRSLWLTVWAGAIAVCLFFSLILNFPSPNKYKQKEENTAYHIVQRY